MLKKLGYRISLIISIIVHVAQKYRHQLSRRTCTKHTIGVMVDVLDCTVCVDKDCQV